MGMNSAPNPRPTMATRTFLAMMGAGSEGRRRDAERIPAVNGGGNRAAGDPTSGGMAESGIIEQPGRVLGPVNDAQDFDPVGSWPVDHQVLAESSDGREPEVGQRGGGQVVRLTEKGLGGVPGGG